jgi:membrane-bound lytic murein transglycosylase B
MNRRQVYLQVFLFQACLALTLVAPSTFARADDGNGFATFLTQLWPDAAARGIDRATFARAFAGVTPDPGVLAAMRREPEYGKPYAAYLDGLVSPSRIAIGQRKLAQFADTLGRVERAYGVERTVLVSIWGVESSFGEAPAHWDVFRSLATLAQAGFQHPLFRDELLSALKMLHDDPLPRSEFVGSWAGAMGQAQFLPSSYLRYAVDFDGDGRADIWHSVPDVLASIANYLQKSGWRRGLPWGVEVVVPPGFDYRQSRGTFADFARRGFRRADGEPFPTAADAEAAILFFPSGAAGPAFLVTGNFIVLKRYNDSDAYALAVGELSDRLRGAGPIRAAWPRDDVQPSRHERIALQRRLADLGYAVKDFTGHLDFDQRDAIRELEQRFGMPPDGHPSPDFLARLGIR